MAAHIWLFKFQSAVVFCRSHWAFNFYTWKRGLLPFGPTVEQA